MKGTINIVIEEQENKTAFSSEIRVENVTYLGCCQCIQHLMRGLDMDNDEQKLFALGLLSGVLESTHVSEETTDLSPEEGGAEA